MAPTELVTAAQEGLAVTRRGPGEPRLPGDPPAADAAQRREFGNEFRYRTGPLDLATRRGQRRSRGWTVTTCSVDLVQVAAGLGARAIRATTAAEVRDALDETRDHHGPVVIVVPVIPHVDLPGAGVLVGRRPGRGVRRRASRPACGPSTRARLAKQRWFG